MVSESDPVVWAKLSHPVRVWTRDLGFTGVTVESPCGSELCLKPVVESSSSISSSVLVDVCVETGIWISREREPGLDLCRTG